MVTMSHETGAIILTNDYVGYAKDGKGGAPVLMVSLGVFQIEGRSLIYRLSISNLIPISEYNHVVVVLIVRELRPGDKLAVLMLFTFRNVCRDYMQFVMGDGSIVSAGTIR